jgi:ribokinase
MSAPAITVVGSISIDRSLLVDHPPAPGETVLGSGTHWSLGGKGGNQAVAAARLGASVMLVAATGDDPEGQRLRDGLEREGVGVSRIVAVPGVASGLAVIAVTADGESTILVDPGANRALAPEHVAASAAELRESAVVMIQLETSIDVALAAAREAAGCVLLNPAPVPEGGLPAELLELVDVLVPNRVELARIAAASIPASDREAATLASGIRGPGALVVTLGGEGALLVRDGQVDHFPATPVEVVDTTGAGDAFCGALAEALSRSLELDEALPRACRAAAVATTARGAQTALPRPFELSGI